MTRISQWLIVVSGSSMLIRDTPLTTTYVRRDFREISIDGIIWNMKRRSSKNACTSRPKCMALPKRTRAVLHIT